MSAPALLAARGVTKSFAVGDRRLEVLHGVDLELAEGELLGLVGASGAGKSTLLHILGLLDPPTAGKVLLEGKDAWSLPGLERARLRNQRIGFVFQFYHLLPELDAVENVILPAMIGRSGLRWRSAARKLRTRAEETLGRFGLGERLSHRPGQLSGGEQQRVAIARAIVTDPDLIVADEPTGDLDAKSAVEVLTLLRELNRAFEKTVVMVTHDPRAERFVDTVIRLDKGVLANGGAPAGQSA